jgi:hypothetical protein
MELQPCTACRRHIATNHARCPFCDASSSPAEMPERAFVRMSRAMVFAGATLAAACGGSRAPQPAATSSTSTQASPPPVTPDAGAAAVAGPDPWASPPRPPPVDAGVVVDAAPVVVKQPIHVQEHYQNHPCSEPDPARVAEAQKKLAAAKTPDEKQRAQQELWGAQMPICAPYGAPPARRRVL